MRRAWAVVWALYLSSVVVIFNQYKVPPVMEALMYDLHVDMVTGGWLMSLFALAGSLLALPAGFLLNRLGPKPSGLIGLGCSVLGGVLGALASGAPVLLLGRAIEGIGLALMAVIAPAVLAVWFEPHEVGLPMGIWSTWVPVGCSIAYNFAGPLEAAYGWRGVWWVGTALAVIAFVVHGLVVTWPENRARGTGEKAATPKLLPPTAAFRNQDVWLLAFIFFSFMFSAVGYSTWAPVYYHEALRVDTVAANFYTSLMYIATALGALVCGWVLARVQNRRFVMLVAVVVTGVLYCFGFSLSSASLIAPYMLARGFIAAFIATSIFALAPEITPSPQLSGPIMAIINLGHNLGMLVGPPVLGQTLKYASIWAVGNYPIIVSMVLATVATLLFVTRRKMGPQNYTSAKLSGRGINGRL
ncbi:MFS transporter [Moorellaceae bacterium AZ2]